MQVSVLGQGYVGLTAAVGLTEAGHHVTGIEVDAARLQMLSSGRAPFYEPGMAEVLAASLASGRLRFGSSLRDAPSDTDVALLAVGTPALPGGGCDLGQVNAAIVDVLAMPSPPPAILLKSTVPPGTSHRLIDKYGAHRSLHERFIYSPEFLNQGTALAEWRDPPRTVIGLWNEELLPTVDDLYSGIGGPRIVTTPTEAEMVKYTANAFLATKTSFINEIANACERFGADIDRVVNAIGSDPRIGSYFWKVGHGYGDSCLSKDIRALTRESYASGYPLRLLEVVEAVNESQRYKPLNIVRDALATDRDSEPPGIAVLGLNFEAHSDDMAHAASRVLVPGFVALASEVRVWDPLLTTSKVAELFPATTRCTSLDEAVDGAGVIVVLTDFPEAVRADWAALARSVTRPGLVVDGKNCLSPDRVRSAGLDYRGMGRSRWTTPWPDGESTLHGNGAKNRAAGRRRT